MWIESMMTCNRTLRSATALASALASALALLTAGQVFAQQELPGPGDTYVAMGSSYAAGPGIAPSADEPATRCARSAKNYAHQLANRLHLNLIDVSCSGATTAHILGPWNELPAQIDAITTQTRLVTITIGGNDINYVRDLVAMSCMTQNAGKAQAVSSSSCPTVILPDEASYAALEMSLGRIAEAVHLRAPKAKLIFVTYPVVLPDQDLCPQTPLTPDQADSLRNLAHRLETITKQIALVHHADILPSASVSAGHDACGAPAWMNGFIKADGSRTVVPYHPNLEGMTAIAVALEAKLHR